MNRRHDRQNSLKLVGLGLACVLLFPMFGKTGAAEFPLDSARGRQSLEKSGGAGKRPNVVLVFAAVQPAIIAQMKQQYEAWFDEVAARWLQQPTEKAE